MKKLIAIPVTLCLMVFTFGARWAVAQTQATEEGTAVQELFTEVSPEALSAQSIQGEPDPSVVRSRFVRVNLDRLDEVESIALNFFEDEMITAVRERVEYRSQNRYTWFGEVPGKEFGDVVLTIENGILVGGVRIDGKLYRVEPLEDGLHIVRQLDPTAFPRDKAPNVRIPYLNFGSTQLRALQEPQLQNDDCSTIDIMVVYTDDAASSSIGAQIQYAIDVTNATYEKSFINQRLRLVHTAQVNYAEPRNCDTTLECITNPTDQCLDDIHAWRDQYHADIVSLWVEHVMDCEDWDPLCLFGGTLGCAWQMDSLDSGFAGWAYNVVVRKSAADNFDLAHEAGHNMGAAHDIHAPMNDGIFDYSHGYVWTGWTGLLWYCRPTVMAYPDYCDNNGYWLTTERIGRWSNPNINWRVCEVAGWPCTNSTRLGIPDAVDNARTLNETACTVANFRQSNQAPVSKAGGPYLAECQGSSTILTLDGTGSSDLEGDELTYSWMTDCPGGSFNNSTDAQPTLTVNTSAVCNLTCNVSLIVNDSGGLSSISDSAKVTIQDTTPPVLDPRPGNVTVECDAVPPSPTVTATDTCDPSVTPSFTQVRVDDSCPSNYILTRTWIVSDYCGNAAAHTQEVIVKDTTPPVILCNAPSIITPPNAPISFTVTATDNCSTASVEIESFNCTSKKGRSKCESCAIEYTGDTITILDSGGVGNKISWLVHATDDCGNSSEKSCSVLVVNPGKNK